MYESKQCQDMCGKQIQQQREIGNSTIAVRHFNTTLTVIDSLMRQKIIEDILNLNNIFSVFNYLYMYFHHHLSYIYVSIT